MGSHGTPPPLCAWKDGRFHPDDPCLIPGGNWQYELPLLRPRNFTMRDSTVNGGDDNVRTVFAFLLLPVALTCLIDAGVHQERYTRSPCRERGFY